MNNTTKTKNTKGKRKHVIIGTPIHSSKGKVIGQVIADTYVKDIDNGCILNKFQSIASDICSLHEAERAGGVYVEWTNTDTGVIYKTSIAKFWDLGKFINYVSPQQMLGLSHFEHVRDPQITSHTEAPEYEDPNGTHDEKPLEYKSRAPVGVKYTKNPKRTMKQLHMFGGWK
jgi:hypothetical protein